MQDFIVLGLIPGTQIQISFYAWLCMFAGSALLAIVLKHRRAIRTWLIAWYVSHLVKTRILS